MARTMNEMEIKQLVQSEIKACFEEISNDVKDIRQALLGDGKYQTSGLVAKVESHENYIMRAESIGLPQRALQPLEWFERLSSPEGSEGKSKLQLLEDGIDVLKTMKTLKRWAVFFGVTNMGALVAFITSLINNK